MKEDKLMIDNLQQYFSPEQRFFLNEINYRIIENSDQLDEYNLNCTDSVYVDINDDIGLSIVFTRVLKFEPENLFELSVSFTAILTFIKEKKDEINWCDIELAEEFRTNGDFVLKNLVSRAVLQIAQITSSSGQFPIISPPDVLGKNSV